MLSFRHPSDLLKSGLYNEETFYSAFARDIHHCKHELIIESPFITNRRVAALLPAFCKLINRGVKIYVNTRLPEDNDDYMRAQAEEAVRILQNIGIEVLFTGGHHRKIAILDRRILWEGSLNILSQHESCEFMRRIESATLTKQMLHFLKISKFLR